MAIHPDLPKQVTDYIDTIPAEHRPLFDTLHDLAIETITGVKVVFSYNMPAYVGANGRVSLSNGPHGVSLSTRVPEPIAVFHAKHPSFKAGKVSVLFPPATDVPVADVATLIAEATR
ncbi:DUF1801 domain-containing protein [Nocardia brevicatena]|uniref:DUF1801 domain-containing protein n=1 Tax=Nocardia brevicatena TaxID=37327 RepID=UPI0002D83E83|nr:DUF1801 domain-containing protein [Nocardia brevicatena]